MNFLLLAFERRLLCNSRDYRRHLVSVNCVHLTCGNRREEEFSNRPPPPPRDDGRVHRAGKLGSGSRGTRLRGDFLLVSCKVASDQLPWIYLSKNSKKSLHRSWQRGWVCLCLLLDFSPLVPRSKLKMMP